MTKNPNINLLEMKTKLSTLWIVVLFNMLFRDIHEFARTGFLEEMLAMTSNGAQISEGLLLAAAIFLQIPIGMIFLTQVLNVKVNRWANLIAAIITIVMIAKIADWEATLARLSPDLSKSIPSCPSSASITWKFFSLK